jgi:hypothetical protein
VGRTNSWRILASFAAAVFLLPCSPAFGGGVVVASSVFNTGRNGWTGIVVASDGTVSNNAGVTWNDPTQPPHYQGNPGGFLLFDDSTSDAGVSYVVAPAKFLGNYYGLGLAQAGVLSFDHKIFSSGTGDTYDKYQVKLTGGTGGDITALWTGPLPTITNFTTDWETVNVPLNFPNNWKVTGGSFGDLLKNVTGMDIRIELVDNDHPNASRKDIEGIDNVFLRSVPEPGSLTLAGVCLGGLSIWRQWRKGR